MKFFPLIWATLWRKKARTIFTLLSIVVAFLLFGVLETVDYAFAHPSTGVSGASLLITINKYSITLQLPFADEQQIRSVPGVAEVTWLTWFGAYYQEPKNSCSRCPSISTVTSICTGVILSTVTRTCRLSATAATALWSTPHS